MNHIKQRESRIITCSSGTERRRFAMKECVDSFLEMGAEPHQILTYFIESFGETTALTYATTIQAMEPYKMFRASRKWADLLSVMKLKAQKANKKQARPLTPEFANTILNLSKTWPATLALFLWISASRYGDLQHMKFEAELTVQHGLTCILLNMAGSKGDPDGSRKDTKAIFIPTPWSDPLKEEVRRQVIAREEIIQLRSSLPEGLPAVRRKKLSGEKRPTSMYLIVKEINNILGLRKGGTPQPTNDLPELPLERDFSAHSMRVGAVHTLLLHFRLTQIAALTLHGQVARKELGALTTYTARAHFGEEREKLQMAMSLFLLRQIGLISPLNAHELAQQMFLPVAFVSQDTA